MGEQKVLLIGANGQLGSDLTRVLAARGLAYTPVCHADLDIRDPKAVDAQLEQHRPGVVINTAAFHNVERCESEHAMAFEVNASAVRNLGTACARVGAVLVHISTDFVFGAGAKATPYSETDIPGPLNVYGVSKLAGEYLLSTATDRYYLVRSCGLFGTAGSGIKGGNFVETMLRKAEAGNPIRVVQDQVLTPTYTADLAEAIVQLMTTGKFGLYHASAEGECSWYEFARAIFEFSNMTVDLKPVSSAELPSKVKRPAYSVLSKAKIRSLGIHMPEWRDGLQRYLAARRAKT